jgi:hypothetical protein
MRKVNICENVYVFFLYFLILLDSNRFIFGLKDTSHHTTQKLRNITRKKRTYNECYPNKIALLHKNKL